MKRPRQRLTALVAAVTLVAFLGAYVRLGDGPGRRLYPMEGLLRRPETAADATSSSDDDGPLSKQMADSGLHPIAFLVRQSEREFDEMRARQSRTLREAVAEYRRRYGIPPPPLFDKWFEFATANGVQLVDEFDTVHQQLLPFWGMRPETIRARLKLALSHEGNELLEVSVRAGRASHSRPAHWIRDAVLEMMARFAHHLPDMDLAVNAYDEPRVVVPAEDVARLLSRARAGDLRAAAANARPVGAFTPPPPADLVGAEERTSVTRFNSFPWQATWTVSRLSCPADSPARRLDDGDEADEAGRYRAGPLGFVYNFTAMSDLCLSPSLRQRHGFFDGPDSFSVAQELLPVFSQARPSSYSDILYPLPYYWSEVVKYDEADDVPWADKTAKAFWRGSTSGGHLLDDGNWRRHHRERLVQRVNNDSQAAVLTRRPGDGGWEAATVARAEYEALFDVAFSGFLQCEPDACAAARRAYGQAPRTPQAAAWRYRYLLDLDGNSFSGRFYAFMRSRSLALKQTLFREWHLDRLRPWVHYVPLSQEADELVEAVRFLDGDGRAEAERMAAQGRDWAARALRREDMEAWFFRLLLEYARVVDDRRASLGFDMDAAETEHGPEQQ